MVSGDDQSPPGQAGQPEAGDAPQQQLLNTQQSRHDQTSTEHWLTSVLREKLSAQGGGTKIVCVCVCVDQQTRVLERDMYIYNLPCVEIVLSVILRYWWICFLLLSNISE